jgi:ribonuclease BN (tRNA processing enzyme)
VRLRVVGSSAAAPRAGCASSCYLIEAAGTAIVADCGFGAYAKLASAIEPREIAALLLSHMHADHVWDVVPFRNAIKYGKKRDVALPLYLPPNGSTRSPTFGSTIRTKR